MAKEILKCITCHEYTLKDVHCGEETITIKPAKYSPEDKFGFYRRKEKLKHDLENQ